MTEWRNTEAGEVALRLLRWDEAPEQLAAIRTRVFIHEQRVPVELEQDGLDPNCLHALAQDAAGNSVGTGRLLPDGRIGRLAVLQEQRGRGIGAALLRALMTAAHQRRLREVHLHAQAHAVAFYERHGFRREGEPFCEAGIPHMQMRAALDP